MSELFETTAGNQGVVQPSGVLFFSFSRPVRVEPTDGVEVWQVGNMLEFGERVVREDECLECLERSDAARRLGQSAMARIQDCTTRDGSALPKGLGEQAGLVVYGPNKVESDSTPFQAPSRLRSLPVTLSQVRDRAASLTNVTSVNPQLLKFSLESAA